MYKPACVVQYKSRGCCSCIAICFLFFSIMRLSLFDPVIAHLDSKNGAFSCNLNSSLAFRLHSFRTVLIASFRSHFAAILSDLCAASLCGTSLAR